MVARSARPPQEDFFSRSSAALQRAAPSCRLEVLMRVEARMTEQTIVRQGYSDGVW
jgi:hypothetical protein